MEDIPDHMSSKHKSTIENIVLRAGIQSDHIEDIRPASINYQDEIPDDNPEESTKNVVAEEVQINIDSNSDLRIGRLFLRIKANIDKNNDIVNWICIRDGPNRLVAQGESAAHKDMVAELAESTDKYLENNY